MTAAVLKAMRDRAQEPISVAHNRKHLSEALVAARKDVLALAAELERMRAAEERSWQP